jgi:Ferredoxin-like domain in Api92-like protein
MRRRPDGVVEVTVTPEDIEQALPDWYKWRCENWGDKWNAETDRLEKEGNKILLSFSTAWSIPAPIFERLSERFPELKIEGTIREGMMNFGGDLVIHNGEIHYNDCSKEIQAEYVTICDGANKNE